MDDSPQFDISPAEIDRLPNQDKLQLQQWLMTESQKNAVQKCKIYVHPHTAAPWFAPFTIKSMMLVAYQH